MNNYDLGADPMEVEAQQIAQRRKLAELLAHQSGPEGGPIYSNKAGIARMLGGMMAGIDRQGLERQQMELAQRRQSGEREEATRIFDAASGGDAKRAELAKMLAQSSNPAYRQAGLSMVMEKKKEDEPYTLKEGETRYGPDGRIINSNHKPEKPEGPKLGETRKRVSGGEEIQEELTRDGWKEIGRGSRWQPHQPQVDPLVEVVDPANPRRTVMVPRSQAAGKSGPGSLTTARGDREDADGLRKEFNALPEVKNFKAATPMVQSAKKAPNTPAGDIDLIYAVGKTMDPDSVVREGELKLVIAAGSPAQKVAGLANYVMGGGRLAPAQRAELLATLDNRVAALGAQYQNTRKTYEGIAKQRGYDTTGIFTDSPAGATAGARGPGAGTVVDGYRFKGGDPNSRDNWERM